MNQADGFAGGKLARMFRVFAAGHQYCVGGAFSGHDTIEFSNERYTDLPRLPTLALDHRFAAGFLQDQVDAAIRSRSAMLRHRIALPAEGLAD
jgi:hypothetical protein